MTQVPRGCLPHDHGCDLQLNLRPSNGKRTDTRPFAPRLRTVLEKTLRLESTMRFSTTAAATNELTGGLLRRGQDEGTAKRRARKPESKNGSQ